MYRIGENATIGLVTGTVLAVEELSSDEDCGYRVSLCDPSGHVHTLWTQDWEMDTPAPLDTPEDTDAKSVARVPAHKAVLPGKNKALTPS